MPTNSLQTLTREQCRAVDRYAIEQLGIPGVVLMENAGRNAATLIDQWVAPESSCNTPRRTAIICGKGNNGGDGFVLARHLLRLGWDVAVHLVGDPATLTGDAAMNYAPLAQLGIECTRIEGPDAANTFVDVWNRCDVVVDALLGTGFSGEVREPLAGVIRAMNTVTSPLVVAIDVPSALDADTGISGGVAVEADRTITFLAAKPGFSSPEAKRFTGEISVADIGIPPIGILQAIRNKLD